MPVNIIRIDPSDRQDISLYASVPMRLTVDSVLEVTDPPEGLPGLSLRERPEPQPWVKDYSSHPEGDPVYFLRRFICAHNSALFLAMDNGRSVGGAAGIRHCSDAEYFCMTDGRSDIAVLADIRVEPGSQRAGIGSRLFGSVADWARGESLRMLKIETQNTNVQACKFYERMGARLGGIQRHAYESEHEEEAMLLWYFDL